ncbi:C39 family peptidase [Leptolyngbya sp. FACHB-36]|uniref:C39 family peptidase n=1 Tax=Leptolyngbya sp. FACHB-36 TaxID=2692808 RepID=UPI0016805A63|nr:C39 family peptidase [Leptolyngbya sp. FACHB-36]MBD2022548.1 C39 family peptidase [Leptolyngbya sp. FACHB-36]
MPTVLKSLSATNLKRKPIQSSELSDDQKQPIDGGKEFELHSFSLERDHLRVAFAKDLFKGYNTWYAFGKHVQIIKDGAVVFPRPKPKTVKLPIPYKSQLDNQENPTGSCNVTSLAMCLTFLGARRKQSRGQFEDELYQYAEDYGLSRHDPHDLATIVERYGCRDDFRANATIEQVQDWLCEGKPIVIHGYFTSFGHIVVITGFDESGFIVHDPYGEWTPYGYRTDLSGQSVRYSYSMIKNLCIPDGNFWVHFISKK